MTKRMLIGMLISLTLLMGTQAEMRDGYSREGTEAKGVPRLFYLFSPWDPEQMQQAHLLQRAAFSWDRNLQMIGVVEGGLDEEEVGRRLGMEGALLSRERFSQRPEAAFLSQDGAERDYALLLDGDGNLLGRGTGREMCRFFRAASRGEGQVSTDIDDSTWGKIKELFQ